MKNIAILGFGVVGSGIARVLEQNAAKIARTARDEVAIRYILDLREFPDSPYADRVIHEIAPILDLSDVIVDIVETGTTLRENDLAVFTEILPISARLIANKASFKFKNEPIEALLGALRRIVEEKP